MNEVTDIATLFNLNMIIQNMTAVYSGYRVYKVWELADNWYSVELTTAGGSVLRGVIDKHRELLYLDAGSTMALVSALIQEHLDAFNAGHHWRYKGL